MITLYIVALFSLIIGIGGIFTLIEKFPLKLLYYHYHFRKPILWSILIGSLTWQIVSAKNGFPISSIPPLVIIGLATFITYKAHQSNWFKADYFPKMTTKIAVLPIPDESEIAIIEYEGITKAYPLDYVIHHHIVNDQFKDKTVALTYCAMCRSIIPFDVTDVGPLFVASFKNANMIVADKKTGTFFQQATFNSVIGKLHPHSLSMIPFQILPWEVVKKMDPLPLVAEVNKDDFRAFNLPVPGLWKKVTTSELTPGLSNKDKTYPSKTHVIGLHDYDVLYLKSEIPLNTFLVNKELHFGLIKIGSTVNGYKNELNNNSLDFHFNQQGYIEDLRTGTIWDLTGKYLKGKIIHDLIKINLSDEYWFSWKKFHPISKLIKE